MSILAITRAKRIKNKAMAQTCLILRITATGTICLVCTPTGRRKGNSGIFELFGNLVGGFVVTRILIQLSGSHPG